jgi:hypothetical protein
MWRLNIWQYPTIGRVFARATSSAPGPNVGTRSAERVAQDLECGLWRSLNPDSTERDPEFWRKLEEEAQAIAGGMKEPEHGRRMLFVAECYRFLADRAEIRKFHKNVIRGTRQHLVQGAQGVVGNMRTSPTLEHAPAQLRECADEARREADLQANPITQETLLVIEA